MLSVELERALRWARDHASQDSRLQLDSRRVRPGDIFIALPGLSRDGRSYLGAVAAQGAAAALCEAEGSEAFPVPDGLPVLNVPGLRGSLGAFASAYYGDPSASMTGVAVTGTNGKTTTSQWIARLFSGLGRPCAVMGTIGCFFNGRSYCGVPLTTPDPVTLQGLLSDVAAGGARAFALEASSIGLEQGRLAGTAIRHALFTNLTRDHLDYHGTMEAYEQAKAGLFRWEGLQSAVINIDDPAGRRMCAVALDRGVRTIAATSRGGAAPAGTELLEARGVAIGSRGVRFRLAWDGCEHLVEAGVLGHFNVDNLLGAAGVLLAAGEKAADVIEQAQRLEPPPGRMQLVTESGAPLGVVDYCHTPDAVEKALVTLRTVAQARGGKLWALVGAGGNRDHGKRPQMGRIADALADCLVVTSDNPRDEDPAEIAAQVAAGAKAPRIILDRGDAIHQVFCSAAPADVILVAGKGHEDYQEIRGVKHHFSDAETIREALAARRAGAAG